MRFRPATVFDIGVAYGTYELYRAFPDAFYHLIDPTRESLHHMRQLARRLRCEIHPLALGDREGEAMIEIRPDIQGSDLAGGCHATRNPAPRPRAGSPLRSMIGKFDRPALAKIDVQGAELMVLEGMTGRMDSIDAFIVETSTIASVKGGAEVHDVVRFMHDHGFVVADIVGMTRRPLDGATAQVDLLFLPEELARAPRPALGRSGVSRHYWAWRHHFGRYRHRAGTWERYQSRISAPVHITTPA